MSTILLVDDETQILEILTSYLQKDGYHVLTAMTGESAIQIADSAAVDCIILDLMLPDVSGEEVCRRIRKHSRVPILMLTAKSQEADRIHGLEIGADDYLIKPFSPRELVARVRAVMRRAGDYSALSDEFAAGQLIISIRDKTIRKNNIALDVTPNEYRLLTTLARHPGRTWSRDELVREVLGYDFEGYDRTIDTHVKNLRQKIEDDPKQPVYIKTIYGLGYRFDVPVKK
ncbi:response regulator transcription factor [Brevibacillus parabrevis]|uniref:response regulator transcription factor n=1 Tax=Brevibacillus parabrevis TaxID=54914 RepID=UPI0028D2209B|nr:response regulator transcription factor [Brevibacillus parabrevis]